MNVDDAEMKYRRKFSKSLINYAIYALRKVLLVGFANIQAVERNYVKLRAKRTSRTSSKFYLLYSLSHTTILKNARQVASTSLVKSAAAREKVFNELYCSKQQQSESIYVG